MKQPGTSGKIHCKKAASYIHRFISSKVPNFHYLSHYLPQNLLASLVVAFEGEQPTLLRSFVDYAAEEVNKRRLHLFNCPDLPNATVLNTISLIAQCSNALDEIRESGNLVVVRIAIELLHRLAHFILLTPKEQEIKRSVCALIDVVLINMAHPQLYHGHFYLFTRALRTLVFHKKLPLPSLTRMQQVEYLLDPLSRDWYLTCEGCIKQTAKGFHEKLSDQLIVKYMELQGDLDQRELDIISKARVFEIITRMIQRLFGVSPYLFGSGASGLATSGSDMDVVVIQSKQEIKDMVHVAKLWKNGGELDFCPFPSMSRVQIKQPKTPIGASNGSNNRRILFKLQRRAQLGNWEWLDRPPPEVAAIWAGRILADCLARFGWQVECVETARVPILRVVAAVNKAGEPRCVSIANSALTTPTENAKPKSQAVKRNLKAVLSPLVTVGKQRNWDGDVPNPSFDKESKFFSGLESDEIANLNRFVRDEFESRLASDINCSKDRWGRQKELSHSLRKNRSVIEECTISSNISSTVLQNDTITPSSITATATQTQTITTTTSQLVQASDDVHLVNLDISFNHEVVVHNTRLMKSYAECDPLLPILGILIKHWAKQRGICDAYNGTLSGYQWMLLLIHFLQHFLIKQNRDEEPPIYLPVLPNLQYPPAAYEGPKVQTVDGRHDAFFFHPFRGPNQPLSPNHQFGRKASTTNSSDALSTLSLMQQGTMSSLPSNRVQTESCCIHNSSNRDTSQEQMPTSLSVSLHAKEKNSVRNKIVPRSQLMCEFLSSDWPEDMYRNRPFEYARHLLTPIDCDALFKLRSDIRAKERLALLEEMRKQSKPEVPDRSTTENCRKRCPVQLETQSTGTVLPCSELTADQNPFVLKSDWNTLSNSITGFFEYFGMRFNCHTHIIDINRTPKLPQRKTDFFDFSGATGAAESSSCEPLSFDVDATPDAPPRTPDIQLTPRRKTREDTKHIDHCDQENTSQAEAKEDIKRDTITTDRLSLDLLANYNWRFMSTVESENSEFEPLDSSDGDIIAKKNSLDNVQDQSMSVLPGEYSSVEGGGVNGQLSDDVDEDITHSDQAESDNNDNDSGSDSDSDIAGTRVPALDPWSVIWDSSSSDCESIPAVKEKRRSSNQRRRQEIIENDIQLSRNISVFRQKQFYCVLDPFERNRIIGPARREAFTQMVFELLRARCLILEAEYQYSQKGYVDFVTLVDQLFQKSKDSSSDPMRYFSGPNSEDTAYYHLQLEVYDKCDANQSFSLNEILKQIRAQSIQVRRRKDILLSQKNIVESKSFYPPSAGAAFQSADKTPDVELEQKVAVPSEIPITSQQQISSNGVGSVSREDLLKRRPNGKKSLKVDIGLSIAEVRSR